MTAAATHDWPSHWSAEQIAAADRYAAGEIAWTELRAAVGLVLAREIEVRTGRWTS